MDSFVLVLFAVLALAAIVGWYRAGLDDYADPPQTVSSELRRILAPVADSQIGRRVVKLVGGLSSPRDTVQAKT